MPITLNALDVALLVLRVAIGVKFLFHGYPKMFKNFSGVVEMVKGVPLFGFAPKFFAAALTATEFFGALFLIVGFLTPLVAVLQAFTQLVAAMMTIQWKNWNEFAVNILLYGNEMVLIILGGGAYSLDALLF